jgi:hypothetical protein
MQRHDHRSRGAGSQVSLWERAAPAFSTRRHRIAVWSPFRRSGRKSPISTRSGIVPADLSVVRDQEAPWPQAQPFSHTDDEGRACWRWSASHCWRSPRCTLPAPKRLTHGMPSSR